MTSLSWKINRLKLMGAPEILWRVQQLAQKKVSKVGIGLIGKPPAPSLARFGTPIVADMPDGTDVAALCAAADAVLAGRWNVFAMRGLNLGFPPQWNRDPKTGTVAPMKLGKAIDYRRESVVGDIKYLWEPSRHLELVTLALAWRATGEQRYAAGARLLLESWFDQCPYPQGVHWTSSLELAVRLLNWAFAWQLLGGADSALFKGDEGARFQRRWLDSVYQHCHFIRGYFSRHSSANNHLFGEYMGLFVASVQWPCWPESARWQALARRGLEIEALQQNTADGVNKEQAIYYHHEVMDMMLLCHRFGAANGAGFPQAYLDRLEKMAEFVSSMMDVSGNVPMTGDGDDAQMVRLSYEDSWSPYRSLLASCALLFERGDFKRKAGRLDDKNRWLFGNAGVEQWNALPEVAEQPVLAFPEGGYYLLGERFGTADEVRIIVDCAPLGYLSIAAHGHADALSMMLSVGGEEFLIDPGTFTYNTRKTWRDYFRGTAAHNTVQVDRLDQSEICGNFMWLKKASARLLEHQPAGTVQSFEGSHDGYQRLSDPVLHRRRVEYDAAEQVIVVTDMLECQGAHALALHWHFAEACRVTAQDNGLRAEGQGHALQMSCSLDANPELLRASEVPLGGWASRNFDEKHPITTAVWHARITGTTKITTRIDIVKPCETTGEGRARAIAAASSEALP